MRILSSLSRQHIFLATVWIFSILFGGCALTTESAELESPATQVFSGSFEEIWRATQKALANYPMAVVNFDQGLMESDAIRSDLAIVPPHLKGKNKQTYKYVIRATALRGTSKGKPSVRIAMEKDIRLTTDFFTGEQQIKSDGWEERLLLYRIERELQLERYMKNAFEKGAKL